MNSFITITKSEYRTCYVKDKKALFHMWTEETDFLMNKNLVGLVEYEDGQVDIVGPKLIQFCDNKILEYAFIKNKETVC